MRWQALLSYHEYAIKKIEAPAGVLRLLKALPYPQRAAKELEIRRCGYFDRFDCVRLTKVLSMRVYNQEGRSLR
jgi:hypothetical protein